MAEYIDRTALGISYADPKAFINPAHAEGWNTAIQIINEAPAADVAPVVHGRWIRFKEHDSCYVHMRCSECSAYWSDPSHADSFRYCPNCGAKMDEN